MSGARNQNWGRWLLDPKRRRLVYPDPYGTGADYDIDLDNCLTSADVLDWICQITGKPWGDKAAIAGLVHAFVDVLRPQEELCSWGQSFTLSPARVIELVAEYDSRPT